MIYGRLLISSLLKTLVFGVNFNRSVCDRSFPETRRCQRKSQEAYCIGGMSLETSDLSTVTLRMRVNISASFVFLQKISDQERLTKSKQGL